MDQDKRKVLTVKSKITVVALVAIVVALVFALSSYATSMRYMATSEVESKLRFGMTKEEAFEALSVSHRGAHNESIHPYYEGTMTFVSFGSDGMTIFFPQVEYKLFFMEGRLVDVHANEVHITEENGRYLDLPGSPEGYDPPWSRSEIKPDMAEFARDSRERQL